MKKYVITFVAEDGYERRVINASSILAAIRKISDMYKNDYPEFEIVEVRLYDYHE